MDTLIGMMPACNVPALKFAAKLGVRFHDTIPGACWFYDTGENVPGVITTISRVEIPEWTASL